MFDTFSRFRLRELLMEVQHRVQQTVDGRDRLDDLLETMLALNSGLDLSDTVASIIHTAIGLLDARYRAPVGAGATMN